MSYISEEGFNLVSIHETLIQTSHFERRHNANGLHCMESKTSYKLYLI